MSCQKEATAQQSGSNYTLPFATTSTLGGVIIGNGLSVTGNGTLSVNSTGGNYTLPAGTASTLGGFIVGNGLSVTSNGTLSVNPSSTGLAQLNIILFQKYNDNTGINELWTVNIDGTNQKKIPINLNLPIISARLTPDGKKVVFSTDGTNSKNGYIYSCSIDGSNLTKIVDNPTLNLEFSLEGVY